MQNYQATPDFYREYIQHYNHNHSPVDGKFTSGSGSSVSKINQTEKHFKNASEISQIKSNKKNIAADLARDMIDDFRRWTEIDDETKFEDYLEIGGKKVTEGQMKKHLTSQIIKSINKNVGDGSEEHELVKWKDGDVTFYIDPPPEYLDQPIYIDYNPKRKKITNWGYV